MKRAIPILLPNPEARHLQVFTFFVNSISLRFNIFLPANYHADIRCSLIVTHFSVAFLKNLHSFVKLPTRPSPIPGMRTIFAESRRSVQRIGPLTPQQILAIPRL